VESQIRDQSSTWHFCHTLLRHRRTESALRRGTIVDVTVRNETLIFERHLGPERLAVAINFGDSPVEIPWSTGEIAEMLIPATTPPHLAPNAAVMVRLR
jgi:glycosidase